MPAVATGAFGARPERFELPTFGSVDRRSIQLSYGRLPADSNLVRRGDDHAEGAATALIAEVPGGARRAVVNHSRRRRIAGDVDRGGVRWLLLRAYWVRRGGGRSRRSAPRSHPRSPSTPQTQSSGSSTPERRPIWASPRSSRSWSRSR